MHASPQMKRRQVLSVGLGLGLALLGTKNAEAQVPLGASLKDLSKAETEAKAAKAAQAAAMANRPKELRNEESCYMWNGKKECFSCKKSCEAWKTVSPELDCDKYCTVEYGAPKPTDEESVSFSAFVDAVNKGAVTMVDFYGPAGDKAYASFKEGGKIRIGEGFPMEIGNEPSSPLQVVRLLKQKEVPYKFHYLDNVKYQKIGN